MILLFALLSSAFAQTPADTLATQINKIKSYCSKPEDLTKNALGYVVYSPSIRLEGADVLVQARVQGLSCTQGFKWKKIDLTEAVEVQNRRGPIKLQFKKPEVLVISPHYKTIGTERIVAGESEHLYEMKIPIYIAFHDSTTGELEKTGKAKFRLDIAVRGDLESEEKGQVNALGSITGQKFPVYAEILRSGREFQIRVLP